MICGAPRNGPTTLLHRQSRPTRTPPVPPATHHRRPCAFGSFVATVNLLCLVSSVAGAQRVFHGAPSAGWIAPPNIPGDSFVVFHARRSFELSTVPAHFLVHVSADNR